MIQRNERDITIGNTQYFKLPIVEFTQNRNKAFLSSMSISDFEKIAMLRQVDIYENKKVITQTIDIKYVEQNMINKLNALDDEPFNRPEEQKRVNKITDYLNEKNEKIIPNTIIVGTPLKEKNIDLDLSFPDDAQLLEDVTDTDWLESFNDTAGAFISHNYLYVPVTEKSVIIIDGQHRFLAMRQLADNVKDDFFIPIVFLLGYKAEKQAEIFVTINYEQKAVNKSLLTSLKNTFLTEVTDEKILYGYIDFLNTDKRSPLVNKIKMLGVGPGYISLAFLQSLLKELIKPQGKRSKKIPIFSSIFQNGENRYIVLQLLLNYFQAIAITLNKVDFINIQDVLENKNKKCITSDELWEQNCTILTKSVGIGAFVQVLPQIILKVLEKKHPLGSTYMDLKDIQLADFIEILAHLKKFNFKDSLSGSSLGLMNKLKIDMQTLFSIEKYDRKYAENINWIIYI